MAERKIITICTAAVLAITAMLGCGSGKSEIPDIEMVSVGGGTFTMGCTPEPGDDCLTPDNRFLIVVFGRDPEKPAHSVTVGDFSIGKYEVTQRQWKQVMGKKNNPSYSKGDTLPVENVSWIDIQEFISRLNELSGQKYRLPTEAEWEYAARDGAKSKGHKYSGSSAIRDVAWYYENSGDVALDENDWREENLDANNNKTHQVGTKQPNELGIYDMSGNVWEWVNDWFGKYSDGAQTDPQGPESSSARVNRGGGWDGNTEGCRVSYRGLNSPGYRDNSVGFRLALSP
jgi:formylglycine-generating enzyme required for sulfatase activity